jgi:N-glycosylase/DNA lyase
MSTRNMLIEKIRNLQTTNVGQTIRAKLKEFQVKGTMSNDELFSELCFCILTANYSAKQAIEIQSLLTTCFLHDSQKEITHQLRACGYRFPNIRATYIATSREQKDMLRKILTTMQGEKLRSWLITNIKGFGYKEASHFLRNIGYQNYAIIDSHIIDILVHYAIINKPASLTKRRYLAIETLLSDLAYEVGITLAALDLYLWYLETGNIFK